jgi:hypothetical protein
MTTNSVLYIRANPLVEICNLFAVCSSSQSRNFLWPLSNAGEVQTGLATKHTRKVMVRAEENQAWEVTPSTKMIAEHTHREFIPYR